MKNLIPNFTKAFLLSILVFLINSKALGQTPAETFTYSSSSDPNIGGLTITCSSGFKSSAGDVTFAFTPTTSQQIGELSIDVPIVFVGNFTSTLTATISLNDQTIDTQAINLGSTSTSFFSTGVCPSYGHMTISVSEDVSDILNTTSANSLKISIPNGFYGFTFSPVATISLYPQVIQPGQVAAQNFTFGGSADNNIDLSSAFTHLNAATMTYTAISADESIATTSISGYQLTVTEVAEGTTTITVTASDASNNTASLTFEVAIGEADISVTYNDVFSGERGTTITNTFTINNTGTIELQITDISLDNTLFSTATQAVNIPVGSSIDLIVDYDPVATTATDDLATLSIVSNDPDASILDLSLRGRAYIWEGLAWEKISSGLTPLAISNPITIGPDELPYLFLDMGSGNMGLFKFQSGSWVRVGPAFSSNTAYYDLAFDSNDDIYFATRSNASRQTGVYKLNTATNAWDQVGGYIGSYTGSGTGNANNQQLIIGTDDKIYVGFSDGFDGSKAVVYGYDGTWQQLGGSAISLGAVNGNMSLQFSASGSLNAFYCDGISCEQEEFNPLTNSWSTIYSTGTFNNFIGAGDLEISTNGIATYTFQQSLDFDGSGPQQNRGLMTLGGGVSGSFIANANNQFFNYPDLEADSKNNVFFAFRNVNNADYTTLLTYENSSNVDITPAGQTQSAIDQSIAFDSQDNIYLSHQVNGSLEVYRAGFVPFVEVSTSVTDFGQVAQGSSSDLTFTVSNSSQTTLNITGITSGNADFQVSGIPTTVASGASESFTVTFSPSSLGIISSKITVSSDAVQGDQIFTLSGESLVPPPTFSSPSSAGFSENSSGVAYTIMSDDANAIYSLGSSKDESLFTLSGNELTFSTTPDFENPQDVDQDNSYELDIIGTSADGLSSTLSLSIIVVDEIESVSVSSSTDPLGCTQVVTVSLGSSESGVIYELQDTSDDNVLQTINGTGSAVAFPTVTLTSGADLGIVASRGSGYLEFSEEPEDEFVSITGNPLFNHSSFSFEGWFQIDWTARNEGYVAFFGSQNTNGEMRLGALATGEIFFYSNNGTASFITTSGGFPNDMNWHHLAVTYDENLTSGARFKVYVDGVSQTFNSMQDLISGDIISENIWLGKYNDQHSANYNFDGLMDEVSFWNVARSQPAILANMNIPLAGDETGLEVYFDFNEGLGNAISSKAGTSYEGVLENMSQANWQLGAPVKEYFTFPATINFAAPSPSQTVSTDASVLSCGSDLVVLLDGSDTGVNYFLRNDLDDALLTGPIAGTGSSISFPTRTMGASDETFNVLSVTSGGSLFFREDPTNQFVQLEGDPFTDVNGSFTVETRFKVDWNGGDQNSSVQIFGYETGNFHLWIANDGVINVPSASSGFAAQSAGGSFPVDDEWHHVALVYDNSQSSGSKWSIFVDGTAILLLTNMDMAVSGNIGTNFQIGKSNFGDQFAFDGEMDEFRIWNTARSSSEVSANTQTNLVGTETGLIALYPFDEGYGNQVYNSVSGSYNGVVQGYATNELWTSTICSQELSNTPTVTLAPAIALAEPFTLDFGEVSIDQGSAEITYTLENNGAGVLSNFNISSSSSSFVIANNLSSSTEIAAGSSADFTVTYIPNAGLADGTQQSAVITVSSDDCLIPSFDFTVTGTVNDDIAPEFTSSSSVSVDENSTGTFYLISFGDTDLSSLELSYNGSDFDHIELLETFGQYRLEIKASSAGFDYEFPIAGHTPNAYEVDLVATDEAGNQTTFTLAINVNNVNDNEPFIASGQTFSISENETDEITLGTVSASDGDDSLNPLESWTIISDSGLGIFTIDEDLGDIAFDGAFNIDYEANQSYTLNVIVSDGLNTSMSESITINVLDENDNQPTVAASQTFSIAENATEGTSIGTVAVSDPDTEVNFTDIAIDYSSAGSGLFDINHAMGELSLATGATLDFESTTSYTILVSVTDDNVEQSGEPEGDNGSSVAVTINVTDINEFTPVVTPNQVYTFSESIGFDQEVGTLLATDQDGTPLPANSWTIVSGNEDGHLYLSDGYPEVITGISNFDFEAKSIYNLVVTVSDGDNTSAPETVTFQLTDVNEFTPEITLNQSFSICESEPNGTILGQVSATDGDGTAMLSGWTISGANDAFDISSSGEISLADASVLPTVGSHTLSVSVSDGTNTAIPTNIQLEVLGTDAITETISACTSYLWAANNTIYSASGSYIASFTNANGCDSVRILDLTILEEDNFSETVAVCGSYTWPSNGTTYTTTGTYSAVFTNEKGCDSTRVLDLTIFEAEDVTETVSACNSYTWDATQTEYTSSGQYTTTLTNINGCEYTATLDLTIDQTTTSFLSETSCSSHTLPDGRSVSYGGIYWSLDDSEGTGCDDTVRVDLTLPDRFYRARVDSTMEGHVSGSHGTYYNILQTGNTVFAAGDGLLRSEVGGVTYDYLTEDDGLPQSGFWDVAVGNGNIYLSGTDEVFKSTDDGTTWNSVLTIGSFGLPIEKLYVERDLVAAVAWGTVYLSGDGGDNWQSQTISGTSGPGQFFSKVDEQYFSSFGYNDAYVLNFETGSWDFVYNNTNGVFDLIGNDDYLVIATGDGIVLLDGTNTATTVGTAQTIDNTSHTISFVSDLSEKDGILYGASNHGVIVSYDNGENWLYFDLGLSGSQWIRGIEVGSTHLQIATSEAGIFYKELSYFDPTYITNVGVPYVIGSTTFSELGDHLYVDTKTVDGCTVPDVYAISLQGIQWTGASSLAWTDAANWNSGQVPTATDSVTIPRITNSVYPSITSNVTLDKLVIEVGASLIIAPDAALTVEEDLQNDGSMLVSSGASLIAIGDISGNNYIIDRVTTFDKNTGRYSIVGSPVVEAPFNQLGTEALIFAYDESEDYGLNEGAGRYKTPAQLGLSTMQRGVGYFSAFTGDASGRVTFTGAVDMSDVSVNLSYTAPATPAEAPQQGFNLVANPYPAAIDFDIFMSENAAADINESIYIWDDYGSDMARGTNSDYLIVNPTLGNTDSRNEGEAKWDGYIRSGQGFFVKANSATSVSFSKSQLSTGNNDSDGFYRKSAVTSYKLRLSNEEISRAMIVGYVEDATTDEDAKYDASILASGDLSFFSLSPGSQKRFAIQGLPLDYVGEVQLGFETQVAGEFEISLGGKTSASERLILLDLHEEIEIDLSRYSYSFTSKEGEFLDRFVLKPVRALHSLDHDRRPLVFTYQKELTIIDSNPSVVYYHVFNLNGQEVQSVEVNGTAVTDLTKLTDGIYIVTNGEISHRVILKD